MYRVRAKCWEYPIAGGTKKTSDQTGLGERASRGAVLVFSRIFAHPKAPPGVRCNQVVLLPSGSQHSGTLPCVPLLLKRCRLAKAYQYMGTMTRRDTLRAGRGLRVWLPVLLTCCRHWQSCLRCDFWHLLPDPSAHRVGEIFCGKHPFEAPRFSRL